MQLLNGIARKGIRGYQRERVIFLYLLWLLFSVAARRYQVEKISANFLISSRSYGINSRKSAICIPGETHRARIYSKAAAAEEETDSRRITFAPRARRHTPRPKKLSYTLSPHSYKKRERERNSFSTFQPAAKTFHQTIAISLFFFSSG